MSRQAVHGALQRKLVSEARYEGKDGCRITVRLTAELCAAIDKAQRKDETQSDCVVRLLERGLGQ